MFIILVLIVVFRSPVVPFVSLLTVGISYIVSLGIVAHLVDQFNFPFFKFYAGLFNCRPIWNWNGL